MRYEAHGWSKIAERDDRDRGCDLTSTVGCHGEDTFGGATIKEAITACCGFVDVDPASEDVLRDACGEPGRLDVQRYETETGDPATPRDMLAWERGARQLWLATYTFHIEAVERTTVSLL